MFHLVGSVLAGSLVLSPVLFALAGFFLTTRGRRSRLGIAALGAGFAVVAVASATKVFLAPLVDVPA